METTMLAPGRFIRLPTAGTTSFDHGAHDPVTGRVFVAHTSTGQVEVIDHAAGSHLRTLDGFPEAAGVVVAGGVVAVTARGAASVATVDAATLATTGSFPTGPRPNGVAYAPGRRLLVVACLGDADTPPVLQAISVETGETRSLSLPGRPRWCVVDATEDHLFLAIQEPSLVLVVGLPDLREVVRWLLPSAGAHGLDGDETGDRLYVACDGGSLVALDRGTGRVIGAWPLPGVPDATFVNPDSGLVHVAIGEPGVVVTLDPVTGELASCPTEPGAKTTALVRPDRLYVFLPRRGGALELIERRGTSLSGATPTSTEDWCR